MPMPMPRMPTTLDGMRRGARSALGAMPQQGLGSEQQAPPTAPALNAYTSPEDERLSRAAGANNGVQRPGQPQPQPDGPHRGSAFRAPPRAFGSGGAILGGNPAAGATDYGSVHARPDDPSGFSYTGSGLEQGTPREARLPDRGNQQPNMRPSLLDGVRGMMGRNLGPQPAAYQGPAYGDPGYYGEDNPGYEQNDLGDPNLSNVQGGGVSMAPPTQAGGSSSVGTTGSGVLSSFNGGPPAGPPSNPVNGTPNSGPQDTSGGQTAEGAANTFFGGDTEDVAAATAAIQEYLDNGWRFSDGGKDLVKDGEQDIELDDRDDDRILGAANRHRNTAKDAKTAKDDADHEAKMKALYDQLQADLGQALPQMDQGAVDNAIREGSRQDQRAASLSARLAAEGSSFGGGDPGALAGRMGETYQNQSFAGADRAAKMQYQAAHDNFGAQIMQYQQKIQAAMTIAQMMAGDARGEQAHRWAMDAQKELARLEAERADLERRAQDAGIWGGVAGAIGGALGTIGGSMIGAPWLGAITGPAASGAVSAFDDNGLAALAEPYQPYGR